MCEPSFSSSRNSPRAPGTRFFAIKHLIVFSDGRQKKLLSSKRQPPVEASRPRCAKLRPCAHRLAAAWARARAWNHGLAAHCTGWTLGVGCRCSQPIPASRARLLSCLEEVCSGCQDRHCCAAVAAAELPTGKPPSDVRDALLAEARRPERLNFVRTHASGEDARGKIHSNRPIAPL